MKGNAVIDKFVRDQLSQWPLAAASFRSLKGADVRTLDINGLEVKLQHNPGRIRSSVAATDKASLEARPCFLCEQNRFPEQRAVKFDGRKGRRYDILLNPYPIFSRHLVIASTVHTRQSILKRYVDMMDLAHHYTAYTFFYNGPECGASAPDHMHFQACPRGLMPLEKEADRLLDFALASQTDGGVPNGEERICLPDSISCDMEYISSVQEAQLYHYRHFTTGVFFLRARTSKSMAKLFYRLLDCADVPEGAAEPKINVLTWYKSCRGECERPLGNTHGLAPFEYRAIVVFRASHRSHHYFSQGDDHLTMSPGCADMAGLFIVPVPEDYAKLDRKMLTDVVSEVSLSKEAEEMIIWKMTRTQRTVEVGVMSGSEICFEIISDGAGPQKVRAREGRVEYNGTLYDQLYFEARTMSTMFAEPTFILYDVPIGIDFHWERRRTHKFAGSLKFIAAEDKVTAVNIIGVEDYLLSVISSEMKSTADLEFLKAHAVISRSWLANILSSRRKGAVADCPVSGVENLPQLITWLSIHSHPSDCSGREGNEIVKWFDHEDHKGFDVCADDHCQRYQGLSMAVGENVRKAVDETWGEVLTCGGEVCDARFSKCCGGVSELYSTCWEDRDMPYLQSLPDTPGHNPDAEPFCRTDDREVLARILNDYDLETGDFYTWSAEYTREGLSDLVRRRTGCGIGTFESMEALETGPSGRIRRLLLKGSAGSLVIGKELMIRRSLSESHLKSSAFEAVVSGDKVILHGRGWGHGVGLCQIGAAVMASRGYGYREILAHYYPGTEIGNLD